MIRLLQIMTSCVFLSLGSGLASPLADSAAPFQVSVPDGWAQRPYPNDLPGVLVVAPGSPTPVALQFFYAPYQSRGNQGNNAAPLKEFIGGVEESLGGNGQTQVKRLSERPLTVGGLKGTERRYSLTFKGGGTAAQIQCWFAVSRTNLLAFQSTAGPRATPEQKAAFDKVLKTVNFKR